MTIDDKIRDKKTAIWFKREAAKISALSLGKNDMYECLTGEKILPFDERRKIEQAKFTCSPSGKTLEKKLRIKAKTK